MCSSDLGAIVRGASTITQQLARNLYLTGDQNVERKIREAYIALQLNQALSKEQVLEAYMNRVYVEQNAYGVEADTETYFSKSTKDLTLGEAAALAATVKSPTNFALYKLYLPGQEDGERVRRRARTGPRYPAPGPPWGYGTSSSR